jgi:hypothetical protein
LECDQFLKILKPSFVKICKESLDWADRRGEVTGAILQLLSANKTTNRHNIDNKTTNRHNIDNKTTNRHNIDNKRQIGIITIIRYRFNSGVQKKFPKI